MTHDDNPQGDGADATPPPIPETQFWTSRLKELNRDSRFREGDDEVAPVGTGAQPPFKKTKPRPFQKDEHDAITRRVLAFVVLGVVSVLYGAGVFGLLCHSIDMDQLGRIGLVLGPIQALAAAVLGFYFGQERK